LNGSARLTVHRPQPEGNESEIHIWKFIFSWVGQQGKTSLYFDPVTSTYSKDRDDPFEDLTPPSYDTPF